MLSVTDSLPRDERTGQRVGAELPEAVRHAQRQLVQLGQADQAIFLAQLTQELRWCEQVVLLRGEKTVALSRGEAPEGYLDHVLCFVMMRRSLNRALIETLLGRPLDAERLIHSIWGGAVNRGCDAEVLPAFKRVLSAPLRKQRCPCCGYFTLTRRRGEFERCPVCCWIDELPDEHYGVAAASDWFRENRLPLRQARENVVAFGAVSDVSRNHPIRRQPLPEELPENQPPDAPPL